MSNQKKLDLIAERAEYLDTKTSHVAGKTWQANVTLPGGKQRPAGTVLGYIDHNVNIGFAKMQGSIDGLTKLVASLASNPAITPESVQKALDEAAVKAFGPFELSISRAEEVKQPEPVNEKAA